jgi:tetratricopeptide (TPR) repeat protein
LSASQTRLSFLGIAALRRSPGRNLGRAIYLIPPLLAILVVVGVQLANSSSNNAAPVSGTDVLAVGDANVLPQTDISSVGAVDTTDVDRRINFWKQRTTSAPSSDTSWVSLGDLFELKGRMTGDISQYLAAQQSYQSAINVAPNSSTAHAGNARILATLHDFNGALSEASTAVDQNSQALGAVGVIFDSSVELGHLDDAQLALTALQSAASDSPSVGLRQARLDFLRGDSTSALSLADAAASDSSQAGDLPSSTAFYEFTAAEYQLLAGNLDAAQTHYEAALSLLPGYPLAIYGEARVAYGHGDLSGAITLMQTATAALPRPDMLAFLGDLYALSGDQAKATDQYATVDFIASMTASSGATHVYDREYGLFLSDHDRNVAQALMLAQDELAVRKDIYGYDAYAWALHANGRDAEALTAARQALSLGTPDAKILLHAGLIEIANGQTDAGKTHLSQALALNPTVSPLVIDEAKKAVGQ